MENHLILFIITKGHDLRLYTIQSMQTNRNEFMAMTAIPYHNLFVDLALAICKLFNTYSSMTNRRIENGTR